ncbi:MAG TPA: hypothetical protein VGP25_13685 [Gemmatimonadaceae bacterium]|jgi:hypothetical protein|nr:hypothetical protein [Gemmatimonadaceae bacterium]
MTADWIEMSETHGAQPGDPPPSLPLLTHLETLGATEWLRTSLTTFGRSVASFLPGKFSAYARVFHPFDNGGASPIAASTWRELAALAGRDVHDAIAMGEFALYGVANAQARIGSAPLSVTEVLVERLRPATRTPDECFFAVWEGFGGSLVPPTLQPKLELPYRAYDVFAGPLDAARTSYHAWPFHHQSANLWWPADHAWCVATEVDHAWTYVGGPHGCIDALLADSRLEAVETTALAWW